MVTNQRENSPLLAPDRERSSRYNILSNRLLLYAVLPLLIVIIIPISFYFSLSKPKQLLSPTNDSHNGHSIPTSLPPFTNQKHLIPPKLINREKFSQAIPTNAFWTNLLVGDSHGLNIGAGEITLSPFTVRNLPQRLEVSYGDSRRQVTNVSIFEVYHMDLGITTFRAQNEPMSRQITAFDSLSVTVEYAMDVNLTEPFQSDPKRTMTAYLVRGAPYITVEYRDVIPLLEFNGSLVGINGKNLDERQKWTGNRFELDVRADDSTQTQKWVVYFASDRTLTLIQKERQELPPYAQDGALTTPVQFQLVDTKSYTGVLRATVVPNAEILPILDRYAHVYPIGAALTTSVQNGIGCLEYAWKTKRFSVDFIHNDLLMMAHPHQVETLTNQVEITAISTGFRTLKSNMTAIIGQTWSFQIPLIHVGFGIETPIVLEPLHDRKEAIRAALVQDSKYVPLAKDPYFFGKEISRQARLALIAETLKEIALRDKILDRIQEWITPWLNSTNEDIFVYDTVWGGVCSKNGLDGIFWMTDFGNGWYNDHHFHYGYLLYAIAVLAQFRPEIVHAHRDAVFGIVRDIANPNESDIHFPLTRHFSWFDSHSFASGVYVLDGGKSQESVSEAINAYYAVYLLGSAMNVTAIRDMGHLLMTLESRAAEMYWQMPLSSNIYESLYAANKMTGQVGCTKVQYNTWFGPHPEHIHLVNMIPFTPVTKKFIHKSFVKEQYPVLANQTWKRPNYKFDKIWTVYAVLDLAIIDPKAAWDKLITLSDFDDGISMSNSLFWIATRSG